MVMKHLVCHDIRNDVIDHFQLTLHFSHRDIGFSDFVHRPDFS
jgi:hypothetical protein